ncbi:hypothetical protein LLH00_06025 [bacterium]|nr:hypothetical protein [bacterium]
MLVLVLAVLSALPLPLPAQSTNGTVVKFEITSTSTQEVEFDAWTSAGGTAYDTTSNRFIGRVVSLHVDPTANASTPPPDSFDVQVLDERGYDVLMGQGADLDSSAVNFGTEANLGAVRNSTLRLLVKNAGAKKKVKVRLLVR